jgi:hypothetical protein
MYLFILMTSFWIQFADAMEERSWIGGFAAFGPLILFADMAWAFYKRYKEWV